MVGFTYSAPVTLHQGRGCIKENGGLFASYGSRAFVLTGRFAANCRNIALDDVCETLDGVGVSCSVCGRVEENPSVESVSSIAEEIRDFAPDFIVAIGGGSALDTAKAANVLIRAPKNADALKTLYGGAPAGAGAESMGLLPLFGVPTTAGSGSEVAGYAILTRTDLGTKLRMSPLSFFDDAFLDARYIETSPQWLLDAGALDALAHGAESRFNVHTNPMSRMLVDFGFRLFAGFRERLLTRSLTDGDFDDMLLAAAVQGMAVVQSSTTLPHGMGYPLTHEKGMTHGIASALTLGEYLMSFRDEKNRADARSIARSCGFTDLEELAEYIAAITARNTEGCVTQADMARWADDFSRNEQRLRRNPEAVSREDILGIYSRSVGRVRAARSRNGM